MNFILLKSGKKVKYEEGFLTESGIEIIVPKGLGKELRREFQDKLLSERDVAKFIYGESHSLLELCFY